MAHWRKRNPSSQVFNAYLIKWALAGSAFAGILALLSIRPHI